MPGGAGEGGRVAGAGGTDDGEPMTAERHVTHAGGHYVFLRVTVATQGVITDDTPAEIRTVQGVAGVIGSGDRASSRLHLVTGCNRHR